MVDFSSRIASLSPEKREHLLRQLKKSKNNVKQILIAPQARDENKNIFPLSYAQRRLWFLNRLEPDSSVYNMTSAYRLDGLLNIKILKECIDEIVRRHESLRTTFVVIDDQPMQLITPAQTSGVILELQDLKEIDGEIDIEHLVTEEARRPFNLGQGPLFRPKLLQLSGWEHVLILSMHHIISDGWSIGQLLQELSLLYTAYLANNPSPLAELPIQYVDFTIWQREWLQGQELHRQLEYWKKQLEGAPSTEISPDKPRPKIQNFKGAKQSLVLPPSLTQSLKELSQQSGVTLFMTLLCVFKIQISRYTGQTDIVIGTPIANRNRAEVENLIGFFVNTLVLRTHLSGDPSFNELLGRVKETCLGAYAHQDLPFEKLVEELHPQRDLSRTPLFQIFFNMFTPGNSVLKLGELDAQPIKRQEPESKFDMTFYIRQQGERLELQLVYNADLFKSARMAEMLEQYISLLGQIVANPKSRVADYSLVTKAAKTMLPNPVQDLACVWTEAVHQHIQRQAGLQAKRIALIDKRECWSYQQLDKRSNQLANYLRYKGIQREDVVAVYGSRSAELVACLLGVLKAGAAFMILDPAYPAERLITYCQTVQPKGWIQLSFMKKLPPLLDDFIQNSVGDYCVNLTQGIKDNILTQYDTTAPSVEINLDDLAYIIFTSGTTGQPKAIMGTHRPLAHFLQWHSKRFNFTETDHFSLLSGLGHDIALRDIFTPLWVGATLHIPTTEEIISGQLGKWLTHHKITVVHLTPAMGQLLELGQKQNTTLRYLFFGGDRLTSQLVQKMKLFAPNATCVNFYGATETPQAMGYYIVPVADDNEATLIPLGQGIENAQLLVLNASLQLAGVGELGEIHIRTPYLAKGYWGDKTLTEKRFITNPFTGISTDRIYKTGDTGRYLSDGNVAFAGRSDNQVKIRGFRIEPEEVGSALKQHSNVKAAAVTSYEDILGDKQLVAYVVAKQHPPTSFEDLHTFLLKKLPAYMVPFNFVWLDTLPLTPNGKVNYPVLPKPDSVKLETTKEYVAPRDELELQLVKIWESSLNVRPISIRDSFFDLGGHSLLAVSLFTQIQKIFDKDLPLATLFQAPTVEQLANVLRDEGWEPPWDSLVPIQPHGSKPPFFCVHALGGNILTLRDLGGYLGSDQPFYALQSQGLDGKQTIPSSIEDMAAYYIEEIRTIQPEGPYFLGGQSSGGVIAFEMAQQLQAQGQQVAFLTLIDTYSPYRKSPLVLPLRERVSFHWRALLRLGPIYALERAKGQIRRIKSRLEWKVIIIVRKFYLSTKRPLPHALRYTHVREAIRQARKNYSPQVYPGRIVFFRATETFQAYLEDLQGYQRGWDELAGGGLEIYNIPGAHNLEQEPYVGVLADQLGACLDEAQISIGQQKTTA